MRILPDLTGVFFNLVFQKQGRAFALPCFLPAAMREHAQAGRNESLPEIAGNLYDEKAFAALSFFDIIPVYIFVLLWLEMPGKGQEVL